MKKTIMSLAVVSALLSGSAMAELNSMGQADNSASTATLKFTGKVTSSLCQVSTEDISKTIVLGEISAAQLNNSTGRGPSHSFNVALENCDPTVSTISYVIRDQNGSVDTAGGTSAYLVPESSNTSAKNVGVYIADSKGTPIQIGKTVQINATTDGKNALASQTIPLTAYIAKTDGDAVAGDVNAVGVMTIKAAAAGN
ncbi:fimbrial protein [Escherichia albertii]|uniref:fimbrial protein n=1 Tax=Escherichia albertii TaxID=208962 RepID=UPI000743AE87|nr:fimbrial protein [Escherichia albertii]